MSDEASAGELKRLVAVMARLRGPGGCPWDQEQTLRSLSPYLLEETYELLEAIDAQDPEAHREELGDVLLQVVFQARIREEEGAFGLEDVAKGIADKMVRRHPHVFSDGRAETSEEVVRAWEAIKDQEKSERASVMDGVPTALPSLALSQKLQLRAARVGFDWTQVEDVLAKLEEELEELHHARAQGDREGTEAEVGDLLFSVVNLARHLGVSAEDALRGSARRFERRFREVERRLDDQGRSPAEASLAELDELWDEVKSEE
ncbi:MAG: nucleoside triphosphate pyrophosphohydrolase [Myxococcota bacterium]